MTNRKIVLDEDSLEALVKLARGEDPGVSEERLKMVAGTIEAQLPNKSGLSNFIKR